MNNVSLLDDVVSERSTDVSMEFGVEGLNFLSNDFLIFYWDVCHDVMFLDEISGHVDLYCDYEGCCIIYLAQN